MNDENDDQGLDLDTGRHVEDARGYNPEEESDDGIVGQVKNAFGAGSDDSDDVDDEEDANDDELLGDSEDDDEVIVEEDESLV